MRFACICLGGVFAWHLLVCPCCVLHIHAALHLQNQRNGKETTFDNETWHQHNQNSRNPAPHARRLALGLRPLPKPGMPPPCGPFVRSKWGPTGQIPKKGCWIFPFWGTRKHQRKTPSPKTSGAARHCRSGGEVPAWPLQAVASSASRSPGNNRGLRTRRRVVACDWGWHARSHDDMNRFAGRRRD